MKHFKMTMAFVGLLAMGSCTSYHRTIADSNSHVEFESKDWTITAPYGAQGEVTRILGVDWARLFKSKTGSIGGAGAFSIPIVGSFVMPTSADEYAMYDLLKRYPGYDAIFYPQFKRKTFNFLGIYVHSTSEVKARLGRLQVGNGDGDNTDNGE